MKTIEYLVQYGEGGEEIFSVQARNINSGFSKALKLALKPLGNGRVRELHSIAFWQVL